MIEDVEEMERNGRARGEADKRSIDLPRIRVSAFSAEDAEELNKQAENESETTSSSQNSSAPVTSFA